MSTACSKFILKSILGPRLYDRPSARTPEEQAEVECLLGIEDNEGDTPFLSAAFRTNAMLLLFHLLGPLYVSLDETDATQLHRTAAEQCHVERIIVEQKNIHGKTALHKAIEMHSFDFQRLLLKNLLGEFYVDAPLTEALRPLHQQEHIADMMLPTDSEGMTPLNYLFNSFNIDYDIFELFLRNLLGDYFVEADGQTAKSFVHRSGEENDFVYNVMITKSVYSNFRDMEIQYNEDKKKFKLLIEANANYLHRVDLETGYSPSRQFTVFQYVLVWVPILLMLLMRLIQVWCFAPDSSLVNINYKFRVGKPWEEPDYEYMLIGIFILICFFWKT